MTAPRAAIPSLDAVLTAQAAQAPDRIALIDSPNCEAVTGETPRRFTYAQADRAASAIATRLREIGLTPGTVVGLQMPNSAASIVTMLGVMRAGMIPAPLPLLWRRADCVAALAAAGARAIVTCGRVAGFDHAQLALDVAAELFPIRAVCGVGCGIVDGIVPFDDLFAGSDAASDCSWSKDDSGPRIAVITFDTTKDGIVPVARDMSQLLIAGRLVRQRGKIVSHAVILSTLPISSFAGLSAVLVPWLLSGTTLVLHHPFDPDLLHDQIETTGCHVLVVPEAILTALDQSGLPEGADTRSIIAVWRAPEQFAGAAPWVNSDVTLVDVAAFGEIALLAARRPRDGRVRPWPIGPLTISAGGLDCAQLALLPGGTLGIGGPLAARPFRPFASEPPTDPAEEYGPIDTGYSCRISADTDGLVVTAPPAGLVTVGGYCFPLHDLQHMVRGIDSSGILAALPHALCGHRLAGHAANPAAMRDMLQTIGTNPLLAAAFRDHAAVHDQFVPSR